MDQLPLQNIPTERLGSLQIIIAGCARVIPFFLPVKDLSRVFRGKFLAGLKHLNYRKKLQCAGPAAALADSRQFAQLIRRLHRHDWVVDAN
jgi:hypothetical protein